MPLSVSESIASDLLAIGAVFLRPNEPFTWASGIKSPIYCDHRLTLSEPDTRGRIERALADRVRQAFPECEALFGTATAGIPHAAIVAYMMGLPMGYVRGSGKDHGLKNRVEGKLLPGWKVVVVEDLVSTGGSALDAVDALRSAGADALGVVCIFTYNMGRGIDAFRQSGLRLESLTDFDTLADIAARTGAVDPADLPRLRAFRDNPDDTSWIITKPEVV
ncbi:MAG: orotate phosphoribosyltransferase [Oscillospiraceae bacterium]|jgi:orotate phosphoribosyltransferase|nr:orotate phosphoribosyltransferase [Oscillospiraceae bacterium]